MKNTTNKLCAFTLAEVLITLAIIGVVAALTIPTVVKNYKEKLTVSQVKKFYRNFASLVQQWQVEEGCTSNVKDCFAVYADFDCDNAYKNLVSKMKVVKSVKGTAGTTNVDWLPARTTSIDLTNFVTWIQVSNYNPQNYLCKYLLADGTTMSLHTDEVKQSGYALFDINGKKKPNMVGKDTFVIGIGANNNPKYPSVHPYYNEDNSIEYNGGFCNIRNNNDCSSTIDTCTQTSCSPTAYVLKHDKLPPITW